MFNINLSNISHSVKVFLGLFIVLTTGAAFFAIRGFPSTLERNTKDDGSSSQNAIFIAPTDQEKTVVLQGVIRKGFEANSEFGTTHTLEITPGQVFIPVYSKTNNLDLSTGFDVKIEGVEQYDKGLGGKVIRVERVLLK